jgi:hypothetical protein
MMMSRAKVNTVAAALSLPAGDLATDLDLSAACACAADRPGRVGDADIAGTAGRGGDPAGVTTEIKASGTRNLDLNVRRVPPP